MLKGRAGTSAGCSEKSSMRWNVSANVFDSGRLSRGGWCGVVVLVVVVVWVVVEKDSKSQNHRGTCIEHIGSLNIRSPLRWGNIQEWLGHESSWEWGAGVMWRQIKRSHFYWLMHLFISEKSTGFYMSRLSTHFGESSFNMSGHVSSVSWSLHLHGGRQPLNAMHSECLQLSLVTDGNVNSGSGYREQSRRCMEEEHTWRLMAFLPIVLRFGFGKPDCTHFQVSTWVSGL